MSNLQATTRSHDRPNRQARAQFVEAFALKLGFVVGRFRTLMRSLLAICLAWSCLTAAAAGEPKAKLSPPPVAAEASEFKAKPPSSSSVASPVGESKSKTSSPPVAAQGGEKPKPLPPPIARPMGESKAKASSPPMAAQPGESKSKAGQTPDAALRVESKSKPSRPSVAVPEFVSLQQWAEANQMQFVYPKKEEDIRLTNRWTRLSFRVNSLRAEINGINLFLSSPVVLHQGVPSLSQREMDRAIKPILFPAKNKTNQLVKTIVIGAGHGGKDCGYLLGSQQEKKYTLLLAQEVQKLLTKAGFKPVLIRKSDAFVELEDRVRLAKKAKADAYLELHYNCAGPGNHESKGVEVYCLTPAGANSTNGGGDTNSSPLPGNRHDSRNVLLAYQLQKGLVDKSGLADRGVRRARFVVLKDAEMPAALIEAGFMSQPDELRKIQDPVHRRQTARAIVDGLIAYKKLVELKTGPRTTGTGTKDQGPGTKDQGPGTKDQGPRTRDQGPTLTTDN